MSLPQTESHKTPPTAKSPAFQFYPKDFLSDAKVIAMPPEVRGYYITLLCIDWLENGLDVDQIQILAGAMSDEGWLTFGWPLLAKCFVDHPTKPGCITNPRLLKEREKQAEWNRKSSEGGKRSAEVRTKAAKQRIKSNGSELKGGCEMVATKRQPKVNSSSSSSSSFPSSSSSSIAPPGINSNTLSVTQPSAESESFEKPPPDDPPPPPPAPLIEYGKILRMTGADMDRLGKKFGPTLIQAQLTEADEWLENADTPKARKYRKPGYNHYLFFRGWLNRSHTTPNSRASTPRKGAIAANGYSESFNHNMRVLQEALDEEARQNDESRSD